MFCTFCGVENPEYAKFCRKCGAQINLVPAARTPEFTTNVEPGVFPAANTPVYVELPQPQMERALAIETAHDYAGHYKNLTTDELVRLEAEKGSLTAEASRALEGELAARGWPQPSTLAEHAVETISAPMVPYATLTQRFLAYFADVVVVYLIVFSCYFVSGILRVLGKSAFLSEDASEFQLIYVIVLCSYMIVALTIYHTTIGKYALELEVAAAGSASAYPSFWRILFRETLGRFLSSLFFGVGYWRVPSNEKKQAWSDEMAGTVVRVRKVNRTLRKALLAFVTIAFVVDAGLVVYGIQEDERHKMHEAWDKELTSEASDVQAARSRADHIINREPGNLRDWQGSMSQLVPALDDYDRQLETYKQTLLRGEQQNLFDSSAERHQTQVLLQVFEYRKQQSAKQRQEANLILSYDPTVSSFTDLRSSLRLLDSDIGALDQKASELLAQIGIK